ncbi:fibronectin type III domain-containing protein [Usitatibacter palustris]|uniref:Fibronectin type-III domain-containing protein n=1 Tax=Usitatibacter palustris TaxID=2732487 RepID=A0A6M4H6V3_9PROT|nr:fibronectin type III domain-containing protein [Usitatibacter palustris]QJR15102.1 hypothetical protein DSM104440_01919 [Usitatibacter palustris]
MKSFTRALAVLAVSLLSLHANAVTTIVNEAWPAGQVRTLVTNINGPINGQQTSFTGYTAGPYNYVLWPFKVTQTGVYTATAATTGVAVNTTWFLNGFFSPSNTAPTTPLSSFIVAVLSLQSASPYVGTFTGMTFTAGQQYSILVAFNSNSIVGDFATVAITGPGCVIIGPVLCKPTEPLSPAAVGSGTTATVTFAAPTSDGGSPITGYTVVSNPAGGVDSNAGSTSTTHVVTGLTYGTSYTFTVVATNAQGSGGASLPSNSVTAMAVPNAPAIGAATPGNGQVSVAFTAPAANGSAILDYTANCGGTTATGAGSPIVVASLANGTPYTCTASARNAVGNGPASAASASVTPFTIPGAPAIPTVTRGNGQLTVAFTAPASNGSAITGYTVNCGGTIATGTTSPITVSGLTNSTSYTCTVFATNGAGNGPPSAASAPAVPAQSTASGASATGTGTISASFTGGGAACTFAVGQFIPLTGHAASPPNGTAPGATTFPHGLFDFRLTGCTPGSAITMTVTYPAALPAGSVYWKYGPTPSDTRPHWYTLPATIAGTTAIFTITDGQLGDDDLLANGTIVDQGGPGVPGAPGTVTAVPTLSEWMLMLLALVMLGSVVVIRRPSR